MHEIIEIRHLRQEDYEAMKAAMLRAYPGMDSYWRQESIARLLTLFPEGQLVVTVNEQVVAAALAITVNRSKYSDEHTYEQITGNYSFSTHDPAGDTLYGIEVFVDPAYQGRRLARRLYEARKELCERLNLRSIVFGARIAGYHAYQDSLTPKEYVQKVKNREIVDQALNFQLANDFHPVRVIRNYLPGDEASGSYALLMEWDNMLYHDRPASAPTPKTQVRLGLVQWQMRLYDGLDDLFQQVEYFVDALAAYRADFALFPELFHGPLMAETNELAEIDAIRKLSQFSPEILRRFTQLAVKYHINIITGSMPELAPDGKLMNVGYLCRRNGSTERYEKIHVTPNEAKYWALHGGSRLQTFDTDSGRVGVLICYDSEFPELARLLADQGMDILFVPFLTDTQTAYSRVRHCAQARAIENECYVAIAGSVGNLPRVKNMDIQYAQSAVLTPCDFAFPNTGVKSEATPNTEMILVTDVDLSILDKLRQQGSVQNLRNRRHDVYTLSSAELMPKH
ncbi:bifunctional GNAT family N-acetyltransferase/carbon-nitrogen hydrolase family protein [Hymenobacter sp. NST-14]|uniref:bifunctional GNAT family N-acetyltransferase/carbon-nitrogen hydrolase family protein n=1 Tax=Hymenobacter piscis TaxID=2839984 RepID=UPI001C01FBFE|nr:bifunctional GNAT family N-acetyltransferase/carbon-nitrogen hydrolase family protein [Hymenobacter piscis]MBT9392956.1 bifunctional GNAT family N-acetyltransferase/carbon-nitrogen hydrolase family protein [Hymenobacter piscis]